MSQRLNSDLPEVVSFRFIRRAIGWLGMLLPAALLLCELAFNCQQWQPSISHYYYTVSGNLFVGLLCAVGLFLISYKGFSALDDRATNFAGFCAFGIALFPTNMWGDTECEVLTYADNVYRNIIHYACATFFFLTLAYISYFLFTRSKNGKTRRKEKRNMLYRACGLLMAICIILIPICANDWLLGTWFPDNLTFWLEWAALLSFGTSWLVKGEIILKD